MPRRRGPSDDDSLPRWTEAEDATTLPGEAPKLPSRRLIDDDRPTELYHKKSKASLHTSREQTIRGRTISEMIRNGSHQLSRPLAELVSRAKVDLPTARIDERANLVLHHDFEFDRRVGYRLRLELFDPSDRCVEVLAEVDHDGRKIRRGSMMAKLLDI